MRHDSGVQATGIDIEVRRVAARLAGRAADEVLPGQSFADLGLDELDQVELVMAIEERFGVTIPDEAIGGFSTLADIVIFLQPAPAAPKEALGG